MNNPLPGLSLMDEATAKELAPLTVIRTETALSRFPVHRIAKKGNVSIKIEHQASALVWRVSHNSEYGQPGPLAYKLDTLVVNRRIEEKGRPVPKVIKLGSLGEIGAEVGVGEKNPASVKQALLQNAFAAITAKIKFRTVDRTERSLEAAFNRYSLIFKGDTLPDGKVADAVYLILNDIYMDVLNSAVVRPLDYDYMKELPPAAQRFYEIVSYQIYAALLHQNERAKLRYSEYCLLSTAMRYFEFDSVKKQMYKIHLPHVRSGYLGRVSYEETVDEAGQKDWFMWYVPGVNAAREYSEFTQAGRRNRRSPHSDDTASFQEVLPFTVEEKANPPQTEPTLIERLVSAGLNRNSAEKLAKERPEECARQLDYLPFAPPFKTSRGAYLRRAIEDGFTPPSAFLKVQEQEAEHQRNQELSVARNARKAAQEARRAAETQNVDSTMDHLQKNDPEAFSAFLIYVEQEREKYEAKYAGMTSTIRTKMRVNFDMLERQRTRFIEWQASNSSANSEATTV